MSQTEPNLSRYLHMQGVLKGIPITGNFELTPRCNFNCKMCYVHNAKLKDTLTAKDWLNFAAEAKSAGTVFLLLTGGEPLVRSDFEEIYGSIIKMGFLVSVNSNGSLIKDHIELFKKCPPSRINISLYGTNNDAYSDLCGTKKFDDVINGIELIKQAGINVRINSVFTKQNASCADDIIALSKQLGVQIKPTAYAYPPVRLGESNGVNTARLTAQEAGKRTVKNDSIIFEHNFFVKRAKALIAGEVNISDDCESYRHMRCRAGRASFWLTHDAKMRACGMMPSPETYPLKEGFLPAWNRLRQLTESITLPFDCTVCNKRSVCPVCAAMCLAETGGYDKKPTYICEMVEEIISSTKKMLEENK